MRGSVKFLQRIQSPVYQVAVFILVLLVHHTIEGQIEEDYIGIQYQNKMATTNEKIVLRKSEDRGHANHGWLNSYHTFNFADYYNPDFDNWGCLRVINEDRVTAGKGFGTHPHRDFEIFSYIISGELTHRDSMGNIETLHRGDVQFTSAGTGIRHSENNEHKSNEVHFLQMWVQPNQKGLTPQYKTKDYPDEIKKGKLCRIVSGQEADGAIKVNNDIEVFASLLDKGTEVKHKFGPGRRGYLHLVQNGASVSLNGIHTLDGGDGAFISNVNELSILGTSDKTAELVFFDLQ